jgi:hypothetical protein
MAPYQQGIEQAGTAGLGGEIGNAAVQFCSASP